MAQNSWIAGLLNFDRDGDVFIAPQWSGPGERLFGGLFAAQALGAAGLPDDAAECGDFTAPGGAAATTRLLDAHPDLDAVFVASDLMASGAMSVLAARGLSVPDDVAVFGFDDLGVAETTTPRVFHDVTGLAAGTLVEYRAVSVDAAGATVAASTYGSVGLAVDGVVPEDPEEPGPGTGRTDITVSIPGTLNSELGCPGDWQPECAAIRLTHRGNGVYSGTFAVPAGDWLYKIAIDGSWTENYGAGGVADGDNVAFSLASPANVTFVYDDATKWFTSSAQGPLITLPGSYQSEVGCPGDWQPDCVVTSLQDKDGDGIYTYTTSAIPAGSFEVKVAHNLGWDENYGVGGVPGGANIPFTAPGGKPITFTYDIASHVLTVEVTDPPLPGLGQQQAHWIDAGTVA